VVIHPNPQKSHPFGELPPEMISMLDAFDFWFNIVTP